jgi:hypothetical protein
MEHGSNGCDGFKRIISSKKIIRVNPLNQCHLCSINEKSKIEHRSNGCDELERINLHQGVDNHRVHREITQSSQRIIITIPIIQNFYPKLIFASSILVVF